MPQVAAPQQPGRNPTQRSELLFRSPRAAWSEKGTSKITPRHFPAQSGNKSGNNATARYSEQQGVLSGHVKASAHPLTCGFVLRSALRRLGIVARFQARNREFQASDLRFYGAPKGIRILVVLVLVGATWCLLVLKSCGESQ